MRKAAIVSLQADRLTTGAARAPLGSFNANMQPVGVLRTTKRPLESTEGAPEVKRHAGGTAIEYIDLT
jgi:hypothetical protein